MLPSPQKFGKYLLVDRLALGGMAEIYLAKQEGVSGVEKWLVIKKILPHLGTHHEFISMFIDEARLTSHLAHSSIVQIYEFGEIDGEYYLAMEYVAGKNLRQLLAKCEETKKPFPLEHAVFIGKRICEGLDYAHRSRDPHTEDLLNIIHRDISPQNILISYEGEIKLIDFGIAKMGELDVSTQRGILKGKFSYMSPEQAQGMPLDQRTDLFSTGIVLFEMLTRQRLFYSSNEIETLKKVQQANIPAPRLFNPEIPEELEKTLMKVLAKKKEQRYATAREMHQVLSHFLYSYQPHYTSQELSHFMNTLFASEIEAHKKRTHAILLSTVSYSSPRAEEAVTLVRQQPFMTSPSSVTTPPQVSTEQKNRWPMATLIIATLGIMLGYSFYLSQTPRTPQSRPPSSLPPPSQILTKEQTTVMKPTTSLIGYLHVNPTLKSKVYIDGNFQGNSPLTLISVSSGKHKVTLINDEFNLIAETEVEIKPNERKLLDESDFIFKAQQ